ncbi:cytochrome c oxidase assembly factor 7 homolog [Plakobranchus ocellatus]|uniref:Cytochrome c oxidase assembly factor 7 homolog n=1 Tax=Plakobranchus ocellatus TaxID=259542 RepID=A0AAV4AVZ0_9GAST|nr:cytochrome c oxidase assembly factor 7 homolog [Plakobranchus ocellatus]
MARGYDLTDEKETKEYLRDVEIEYKFQCLDQKEPDGCHRLAEFIENVRKNVADAAPIYKENCNERKHPKSCYKYGQCLLTGKGVPGNKADLISALQYYEKSCDLGLGGGCFNAAQLRMTDKVKSQQNTDKLVALLDRACELKDGEACYRLSAFYLVGTLVEKNLKKSFNLAKAGCEAGSMFACNNLSLMYRHGNGTQKDETLSQAAKKRAKELSEQLRKKQPTVALNQ